MLEMMPGAIPFRAGLAPEPSGPLQIKTYAHGPDAKEMENGPRNKFPLAFDKKQMRLLLDVGRTVYPSRSISGCWMPAYG